jgi:hypothetical protein
MLEEPQHHKRGELEGTTSHQAAVAMREVDLLSELERVARVQHQATLRVHIPGRTVVPPAASLPLLPSPSPAACAFGSRPATASPRRPPGAFRLEFTPAARLQVIAAEPHGDALWKKYQQRVAADQHARGTQVAATLPQGGKTTGFMTTRPPPLRRSSTVMLDGHSTCTVSPPASAKPLNVGRPSLRRASTLSIDADIDPPFSTSSSTISSTVAAEGTSSMLCRFCACNS